ncbi:MAG: aldehyde dehydrogenase EutE, partial [Acidimicrobiia bacterium]|nr:aldehyde dehydrogenase EutE [Acidimicrobiia bacterium]
MRDALPESDVQEIIARVRGRMAAHEGADRPAAAMQAAASVSASVVETGDGIFPTVDAAVSAAMRAYTYYHDMGLDVRHKVVEAIRTSMREHGERLAYEAREETGLGRAADKVVKNRLVTTKTPGPEDLDPQVVTGDSGMMITEYAP